MNIAGSPLRSRLPLHTDKPIVNPLELVVDLLCPSRYDAPPCEPIHGKLISYC